MPTPTLPTEYIELQPFADWALPTADQRQKKRRNSTKEELRRFYDAVLPRLEEILTDADNYALGEIPEAFRPVYNIALSAAEVAPHIELYKGDPAVPFAFEESRFVAIHGDHETWRGLPPTQKT